MAIEASVQYRLPNPDYEQYSWVLADEHAPASAPPLLAGAPMMALGGPPKPGEPPRSLIINGYNYQRVGGTDEGAFLRMAKPPETIEDLTRWRQEWLPQVEALAHALETFDASSVPQGAWEQTLGEQDKEVRRVFGGVHLSSVLPARLAVDRFQRAFQEQLGQGRREDANALLQGFPNKSLDRASALWELSRILWANEELRKALNNGAELPAGSPGARGFRERYAAMLRDFGYTTDNGQMDLPSWNEGSPVPLAMVRAYARQNASRSPMAAASQQRTRRLELERELRGLAETDQSAGKLVPLMEMAQQLMPNLEDHNLLCDQRLISAQRVRWLSVGNVLMKRGLVGSPDDVFFYERSELLKALEQGEGIAREEVQERRRLQEGYRLVPPPLHLGMQPSSASEDQIPEEARQGRAIRGVPASAGSYRGRARVIEGLAQASRLKDGDILVVRTTTPPWTPYFGVIGALVTNSGGALSHGAVVAREFGIPAVVDTKNGTALIPDGATIHVDGTSGLVFVE